LACILFVLAAADADDYEQRRKPGRCHCHRGNASWEYLRSPLVPPEDPPHCGLVIAHGSCRNRPRPKGTGAAAWGSQKVECFWKRHAYSWKIRCSACWNDEECDLGDALIGGRDEATRKLLAERVAAESKTLGDEVVVAVSPNFYVVTNQDKKIKLVTKRGTKRLMTAHEIVHLYAQRCELAYQDFVHWFGPEVKMQKPMAVYVVDTERERKAIGARYFGRPGVHMNYAFAYNDRIADGFCGNGFVVGQQHQRNDTRMHGFCRHQVGHILFSCWVVQGGFEEECPRWAWVGAAHFLEKLHELHEDYATYCYGEGGVGEGPQQRWPRRIRKMAAGGRMAPIESFFNRSSLGDVLYEDHLRAWSIMDLMLREDRARWLTLLARLRAREEEGKAFKAELGITPDQFHRRWKDRVLGKRKTMGEIRADGDVDDEPGRRERRRLETTQDREELAGLIRGLDVVKDLRTLESVLGHLGHPSDLVRESLHLVLNRTTDPKLIAFLREQALYDERPLVRAGVARLLGALKHAAARERLEAALGDSHWLVRANAAYALQRIGDPASRPALEAALGEKKAKTWIAVTDAFASFPGRSKKATPALAQRLSHARWQVRLTAARALARVGTEEALDALIDRFGKEGGRLKKEFRAALKAITGDDLGPRADTWRRWWKSQRERHGGLPPKPPEPVDPNPAGDRYADPSSSRRGEPGDPHYYGRRIFSHSVCFVLDTSQSMAFNMKVKVAQIRKLGDIPAVGTRDEIAKAALLDALRNFDPRTRVRIVFFNTDVRLWKRQMVSLTPANLTAAESALRMAMPIGETNFHGALKAALGLHLRPTRDPVLDDIPDTVFFLTDGRPTHGEIRVMPELTSWFADLNRFAKVDLHIIALGDLNIDVPSLEALAKAGNGEFIHVREE
jgi:hypothetical protein